MSYASKVRLWIGIVLIVVVGLIHVLDAPDSFHDAVYKGWLFYANGVASLVAAYGIFKESRWGWPFGLLIAAGSFAGYVASRTIGLPFIPAEPDAWFEPLGLVSLVAELSFVGIFIVTITTHRRLGQDRV